MIKTMKINNLNKSVTLFFALFLQSTIILAQVYFDDSSSSQVNSIDGSATWTADTNGDFIYDNGGTIATQRAILYSTSAYQSQDGFKLTVEYTTGSIDDDESHNLSFGLISDDTDLSTYTGFNPFRAETSVYSVGANLTTDEDTTARGFNFTNGTTHLTLAESGERIQFATGTSTKVTLEIGIGGYWSYRINDEYEASGVLLEGFDLSKSYHVVVYGQDDNGGGKSIESITLEKRYAAGERAEKSRGTWASIDHDAVEQLKDFKTLDYLYARFNDGASVSGNHFVPHKLLERLALEGVSGNDAPIDLVTPSWGDLSLNRPITDVVHDQMLSIKAAGFKVKVYSNSEQFNGTNTDAIEAFNIRWKEWCDTDPEAQAFVNSQPFHTGIWNETTQQYEDATSTFPNRKYMFCYAEFVIKDFALRYGHLIDTWIWDSAHDMVAQGDNATSGLIEEQRIYQAYYNACHAGNPDIAIAFNNGRSGTDYFAYPFAPPKRFEDFTFGHAFGGNLNHANKTPGSTFDRNYLHVSRMTATNGYVYDGGDWTWDDKIVGNFHSKVGSASWRYNADIAWEQDDFNQWNLEAMQAGGAMTWSGSTTRANTTQLYDAAYTLLKGLDDYLAVHENPGPPQWARANTILPDARTGEAYSHTLVEELDFWDPEGDAITMLISNGTIPSWLSITETNPGEWTLSGTPTEVETTNYEFDIQISDGSLQTDRSVELNVVKDQAPTWFDDETILKEAFIGAPYSHTLVDGVHFSDLNNDKIISLIVPNGEASPSWLTITETEPGNWTLSGVPDETVATAYSFNLQINDGSFTTNRLVQLTVNGNVAPVWTGEETLLPVAYVNQPYFHTLVYGVDFSDINGDTLSLLIPNGEASPSWLTITETEPDVWTFSGTPNEDSITDYEFNLQIRDDALEADRLVSLNVQNPISLLIDVQIQATENTTYPTGAVTMTGTGTMPGYDTTFDVDITVTPEGDFITYPNAVVVSGISDNGGATTAKSWGISDDGTNDALGDRVFQGDQGFTATMSNATLANITSTSGLTADNITIETFKSITIINGQSTGDRFTFSADGSTDIELGRFNNEQIKVVDLVQESGDTQIESFTIKNGSTATNNKWSVEDITVQVTVDVSSVSLSTNDFKNTADIYRIYPNPTKDNISLTKPVHSVKIMDLTGKVVMTYEVETKNIEVPHLESGIYVFKGLGAEGILLTKKFIKE